MDEDRLWLLVSAKLSGEAMQEELNELNLILKDHPEIGLRIEVFNNSWSQKFPDKEPEKEVAFNRHLQRLSNHLAEPVLKYEMPEQTEEQFSEIMKAKPIKKYRKRLWIGTGITASIAAIFFILFGRNSQTESGKSSPNIVMTKPGSKSKVLLPDGTQVWLNADSKLTFNESFFGNFREVQLVGEAYFDVIKDKNHPFIIHTSAIDLKVLGTAFNVRSYSDEKITETALFRGSVEITMHNDPEKKIILKPNEKLLVQNNQQPLLTTHHKHVEKITDIPLMIVSKVHFVKSDTVATEALWTKNKLSFDGETLSDVTLKIERWYDVKVNIKDESIRNQDYHYHAIFEDETLQQVMEAMSITGNFKYSIAKRQVTITK